MAESTKVPKSVAAKTREELETALLRLQASLGMRVAFISIYYDTNTKEHVAWYLADFGQGSF